MIQDLQLLKTLSWRAVDVDHWKSPGNNKPFSWLFKRGERVEGLEKDWELELGSPSLEQRFNNIIKIDFFCLTKMVDNNFYAISD